MDNNLKFQNTFLNYLTIYINGALFSRTDIFLSIFFPFIPFIRHAHTITQRYHCLVNKISEKKDIDKKICIGTYKGKNTYIHKMIYYLYKHLRDDFLGAYVHGSLGTYEEILYSDFDSLVILKDEVFETPERLSKIAIKLNSARSFMYDFDPLQHHGWFVLTQADLQCYPEYYFPSELFKHAKSLFPDKGLNLNIRVQNPSKKYLENFNNLSQSIIERLSKKDYPKNMYHLKVLLSQFMLLPAFYIQVCNKKGIYKKFSFEEAKKDFLARDWAIMDEVSSIRAAWDYKISRYKKWIMSFPNYLSRFFVKHFSPKIPNKIYDKLTPQFYYEMRRLILLMRNELQ